MTIFDPIRTLPRWLMVALAAALLALPVAAAEPVVLKIATVSPDGASWMRQMRDGAEAIARRTEGRVKFRFYPGGIMGNDHSVLRKIRIGQLHGGALTGGSLGDLDPSWQLYSLPFLFASLDEVSFVRERLDRVLIDSLAAKGMVSFGLAEGGFAYLMSSQPIRRLADLQARKVWAAAMDPISRSAAEQAGINAIPLPLPDVLTGLQTGLVDTVATSPIAAIALQWHTRVRYLTDTPLAYFFATLVVDRRVFERIAAADQAIVREVMGETFRRIDAENRRDNVSALAALADEHIEFVQLDRDSLARLRDIAASLRAEMERSGMFDRALVAALHAHLTAFRQGDALRVSASR